MGIGPRPWQAPLRRWRALLAAACAAVGGCAHVAAPTIDPAALRDESYMPAVAVPTRDEIFAVTPPMRGFLEREAARTRARRGPLRGLVDALQADGRLRLDYDASRTRVASEAFETRRGNCLSLVVMTAALAHELGLQVQYQDMDVHVWERHSEQHIDLRIGHVNVLLGPSERELRSVAGPQTWLVVDFMPSAQARGRQGHAIDEARIVAMLLNNRAGEALIDGDLRRAYWNARGAVLADPGFAHAWNTLGVVHTRQRELGAAESALRAAIARDPQHDAAMGNLAGVLRVQGKPDEARRWVQRQQQWQADQPGALYEAGRRAFAAREWPRARRLFERALQRSGGWHELHFALALTYAHLGEWERTRDHLERARDSGTTPELRRRYASKLDALQRPVETAAGQR